MKLKSVLKYSIPAMVVAGMMSTGVAQAATTWVQAQLGISSIISGGKTISKPPKLAYNGTTYVQLYSIQTALRNAGWQADWNGNVGSFTLNPPAPSTNITGPHLDTLLFSTKSQDVSFTTASDGTETYSNVTQTLPSNPSVFSTLAVLKDIPQGPHKIESQLFDSAGNEIGVSDQLFTGDVQVNDEEIINDWSNMPLTSGYNVVKVYLDGTYIGSGEVWVN